MYIPYRCKVVIITFQYLQWLLIGYAVVSSTGFLFINYWKELDNYITNRKYFILGIVFLAQVTLFFTLKLVFFAKFTQIIKK
jgi:hypothetical protein